MTTHASNWKDVVELYVDGDYNHNLAPEQARKLSDELYEAAVAAEKYEDPRDFDPTPGTLYRDANGDRALFVVSGDKHDYEDDEVVLWRIPFDHDDAATYGRRGYWEDPPDRVAKNFVRVMNRTRPLNADGSY